MTMRECNESSADFARRMGWPVGTHIRSKGKSQEFTAVITAIGEKEVLARRTDPYRTRDVEFQFYFNLDFEAYDPEAKKEKSEIREEIENLYELWRAAHEEMEGYVDKLDRIMEAQLDRIDDLLEGQ